MFKKPAGTYMNKLKQKPLWRIKKYYAYNIVKVFSIKHHFSTD